MKDQHNFGDGEVRESRLRPVPFDDIHPNTSRNYLVKGLIPREGLVVAWGPPKSGKSFWTFDLAMHIALGWEYRTRRVAQGSVVYVAAEGADGFKTRVEAFRQHHLAENHGPVPFFLVPAGIDLIGEHRHLIAAITAELGTDCPAVVVLDTLNRSLVGSESKDEDMAEYIRAADMIRATFKCAVIVVHHCGVDGTRPRGHTSLTGAADVQIAVKREQGDGISTRVEWAKDMADGAETFSTLETVEIGIDDDGDPITSCVVVATEAPAPSDTGPKLSKNQETVFSILHEAGQGGLSVSEWNERAKEAGIGKKRSADLYDIRRALKTKDLICKYGGQWSVR